MKTVKVTFNTGDTLTTAINGTDEEIRAYYQTGRQFNLGDGAGGDRMALVDYCQILPEKNQVFWAGQVCEVLEETVSKIKIRFSNSSGPCELWLDRSANLYRVPQAPAIAPAAAPRGHKVIRFYRHNGKEIVHTSSWGDFELILALTGQRFINSAMREMFRDLSGGAISWEEVQP